LADRPFSWTPRSGAKWSGKISRWGKEEEKRSSCVGRASERASFAEKERGITPFPNWRLTFAFFIVRENRGPGLGLYGKRERSMPEGKKEKKGKEPDPTLPFGKRGTILSTECTRTVHINLSA